MPNLPTWSELRKRATPSVMFITPLIFLVLIAAYIRFTYDPEPVVLEINIAEPVIVVGDGSLPLDVTFRLTNILDEAYQLSVDGECRILRWYVVDRSRQIIQSLPPLNCAAQEIYDQIDAESTLVFSTSLALDPSRILAGNRYSLAVRFWGFEAEQQFRVDD